jgi:hypothetical protein
VEVIFLPPNTISLIQPLDQGVIATFKSYCITDIYDSLHEIKQSTIDGCWRKLWPEVVHEAAVIPFNNDNLQDIAQIAHQVGGEGFEDLQPHELEELIRVTHRGNDRRGSRRAHQ